MRVLLLILLALPALAATNRTVTVKTSGGDYTSLAAAIAGEKGDMVSLDRQLTIELYAMGDTTGAVIANADWVTDATRYILLYVPTAERHAGIWNAAKYYLQPSAATGLQIHSTEFVRLDGLQIASTGDRTPLYLGGPDTGAGEIRVSNCILKGNSSMSSKGALTATYTGGASFVVKVYNSLMYGASNAAGFRIDVAGSYYFYNCTFAGNYHGAFNGISGTVYMVNNLFTGNTATGSGAMGAGTDYNRTSNSTLGYTVTGSGNTHDAVSQTFTFVNAGAYDWHLTVDDAGAKDLGVSDPGSGLFSVDVDGETRSGNWDVGFDEYPSAVTRRRNAVVAWRRP